MGLDYLREALGDDLRRLDDGGRFRVEQIRANHTFTQLASQRKLIEHIVDWLESHPYPSSGQRRPTQPGRYRGGPAESEDEPIDIRMAASE